MYKKYGKRILDLILALMAFPFWLIILLIIGPLIYLEDRGSVFYIAPRMGKDGRVFKMYKFRSMTMNAPDIRNEDGSLLNSEDDPRLTRIGKFIRKTSLDETPQLINIIKGDMSIVGPRPNLANRKYETFDEIRKKRVTVRPGVTGYSQAYFRNSIKQDEKFTNDCFYVDNVSFLFDLKVVVMTAKSVLFRKNIYAEQSISRSNETAIEDTIVESNAEIQKGMAVKQS